MYYPHSLMRSLFVLSLLPFSYVQAADKPALTGGGVNPLSITRIHDRVNYMVSLNFNDGKTAQEWHSVDCKNNKAQILYKDLLDNEGLTKARFYGASYSRYAPAQDDKLMTAEDIRTVCKLPIKEAHWERLSATSSVGTTDLVDVNSIQRVGDILSVRMGYDYADIIWEPPYDAPLELKIEHYLYNCKTHQGDAFAAMNIDSEGRVTDSLITADIVRRKSSFKINTQMEERFGQICQLPAGKTFTAEGHFVPAVNKPSSTLMGPSMPDLSNNNSQWLSKFPLSVAIEHQAQSLIKPWALPRFKQIRYTEVSAPGEVKVQLDAQPDGYIRKLEDYGIWTVQRLTLGNQLQLKYTMSISSGSSLLNKLQTDLRFPLVTGQRYQAQWDSIDDDKKVTAATLRCEVTGEGDAHSIAPEFSGKYLLVECHETYEGQRRSSDKSAWLQDLNVFVPVAQQVGDKPESLVKLENVSVIR
ncbi:hypothetical protein QQF54_06230 [Lelliottia sp. V106_10]|uniref:hypothetical protein n=1 Tax=Lelliottia wanjuensis TaxID=3050585 RepID=UPI00254F267C|nr:MULTISPECIES: hypothetical protein [unclassified Lelliottia]MDK9357552.1 hypothetical protein [Lelliottia sp. V106_16]MDK9372956.1 hypothetical protein [Lelliottia sp. V106_10]MDK9599760.1 hypothetical protein [Lelliottia sp. V106_5]